MNNLGQLYDMHNKAEILDTSNLKPHTPSHGSGNDGGGGMLEPRIAKLESDVSYIQRDISKLQKDVESIDSRLSDIETSLSSMKTTFKATGAVVSVVFAFCTYVFGTYVSKILDALNGLVLK